MLTMLGWAVVILIILAAAMLLVAGLVDSLFDQE
jgi:Na+-transporting methylmalonyl-CoA/oxaloacetate decarboxylase gamma subunit